MASSAFAAVFQSPPVPASVGASSILPPPTTAAVVAKPAMVVAPGATSRLIHPAEDISLEEKRAAMPKYAPKTPSLPTPNMETSVSQPQIPVQVPARQLPGGVPPMSMIPVSAPMQQQPRMIVTSAPSMLRPGFPMPNAGQFPGLPHQGLPTRMQGPPQGISPGLMPTVITNPMQRPPLLPHMGQFPGQIPGMQLGMPMRPGILPFPGNRLPQRMPTNFRPRF